MRPATYDRIPDYLKVFVVDQDYSRYTPRDQATWRFIMRSASRLFKEIAHPIYLEGLKKTGIPIDRIPNIVDMDRALSEFGWGALCVRGFIPPLAFLDFQARKILPIAADMRTLEHAAYTPAPDIVHEAAGHAPIIADPEYAEYLTQYAEMARKAIFSSDDIRVYEAIRALSDIKENPDSTPLEIKRAEEALNVANAAVRFDSEAAQVARMYWWTAEYGLVSDGKRPLVFGAGLLSSISEGPSAVLDRVPKVAPSLDGLTQTSYDITRPQPALFLAKSFKELKNLLSDFDKPLPERAASPRWGR